MTKQVAFSNDAYAALRREKREGESFSDLVLRLMREARVSKKDPMRWMNRPHKHVLSMADHLRMVEEGREVDRQRDPWGDERRRQTRSRAAPHHAGDPAEAES